MHLSEIKQKIPSKIFDVLKKEIDILRPVQKKSIQKGILDGRSLLICTPTASGKTLCGELAFTRSIMESIGKAIYIVPLKALASEKYKDFKAKYPFFKTALSIGDMDKSDSYLAGYDLIICTSEKLDSLIRHHTPWIKDVKTVVIDEIHLINDPGRGPTLEILITLLKEILPEIQIIGLSATIGNPKELSEWLDAQLVEDDWRPIKKKKGLYHNNQIEFFENKGY